jgi:hypothetical protein
VTAENANAIITRCQENLVQTPEPLPVSPEPVLTATGTPTPAP